MYNNGAYIVTEPHKVGDKVKALDMLNFGKDGKPTLKLVRIISDSECELCTEQPKGNVKDYDLCVFAMRSDDIVLSTIVRQLSTQPLSIGVWEQSSGAYDTNGKPIKRRVYFVLEDTELSEEVITRVKGKYFDTYEEEKDYIDKLVAKGYYFIQK